MDEFVIQLDNEEPERPVYLGVGENSGKSRFAIIAFEMGADVSVAPYSGEELKQWRENIETSREDNPEWFDYVKVLKKAERNLYCNTPAMFIVDNSSKTISLTGRGDIISAPSAIHGSSIAVCKVKGAGPDYMDTMLGSNPVSRGPAVYQFNPQCRPN